MSVIIILIITSFLVAGGFLVSFLWAVKSGQYDDDYTPSVRMLYDNDVQQNINHDKLITKELNPEIMAKDIAIDKIN